MSTKKSRLKRQPIPDIEEVLEDENEENAEVARIKAPIIWSQTPSGFIIQDLQEQYFEEALNLIKEHFMSTNVLCRNSNILDDQESVDEYLKQTSFHLCDRCSICALHEESNEMIGVLVLRVLHSSDFGKVFSRVKLKSGEAYQKICRVFAYLNRKADVFKKYNCEKFLRYYLLAVHPKFRKRGVGFSMMRAAVDVARSLEVPVVMGIFGSNNLQIKAKKIGMEVLNEVYYVDWCENGEMVFDDPGPGNYTIAVMAGPVLPLE